MIDPLEVGSRLRAVRKALDWKQYEFAEAAGIGKTTYNNWEKGVQFPSVDQAALLCERHGLTMDFIYLGKLDALPTSLSKALSSKPIESAASKSTDTPETSAAATI